MKIIKETYTNEWPSMLINKSILYSNCSNREWTNIHERCLNKCDVYDNGMPMMTTTTREIWITTKTGKVIRFRRVDS